MNKTTIHYLDDPANTLVYIDKDGNEVRKIPFDPEYGDIATRLSVIRTTEFTNAIKRKNYEDSVRNAQISIDAGRGDKAPAVLPVPECEFWPDDYTLPGHTIPWDPPLLTLRPSMTPAPVTPVFNPTAPDAVMQQLRSIFDLLLSHGADIAQIVKAVVK